MKIKKVKGAKMCVIKNIKFQDYKNCLKTAQIERKISYLSKKQTDVDSLEEDQKEFIQNNKIILKTQQRFKRERHVFTEEINKIALSSNDDKIT